MKLALGAIGIFLAITSAKGVDLPWVAIEFAFGMEKDNNTIIKQLDGVPTSEIFQSYAMLVGGFIKDIVDAHFHKVMQDQGQKFDTTLKIAENLARGTSKNAEADLKLLNKMALEASELIPLNATVHIMPELPQSLGPIVIDDSPQTIKELLTKFPERIHKDIDNLRKFMDDLFMRGWMQARYFYQLEQKWMRKRYSNLVIPHLIRNFDEVEKNSEIIKVSSETWEEFLKAKTTLVSTQNYLKSLGGYYG